MHNSVADTVLVSLFVVVHLLEVGRLGLLALFSLLMCFVLRLVHLCRSLAGDVDKLHVLIDCRAVEIRQMCWREDQLGRAKIAVLPRTCFSCVGLVVIKFLFCGDDECVFFYDWDQVLDENVKMFFRVSYELGMFSGDSNEGMIREVSLSKSSDSWKFTSRQPRIHKGQKGSLTRSLHADSVRRSSMICSAPLSNALLVYLIVALGTIVHWLHSGDTCHIAANKTQLLVTFTRLQEPKG